MTTDYYLDLSTISLEEFEKTITEQDLSPGRFILLEDKQTRFAFFRSHGVTTLHDLIKELKTPRRVELVSEKSGISIEYLKVLGRQARSWKPNPVSLARFPVDTRVVESLSRVGIVNSYHLYSVATGVGGERRGGSFSQGAAAAIALQATVPEETKAISKLLAMIDLVRVPGIGPTFAEYFVDCGIGSCTDLANSKTDALLESIVETSRAAGYKGAVTKWDIQNCIDFARRLVSQRT